MHHHVPFNFSPSILKLPKELYKRPIFTFSIPIHSSSQTNLAFFPLKGLLPKSPIISREPNSTDGVLPSFLYLPALLDTVVRSLLLEKFSLKFYDPSISVFLILTWVTPPQYYFPVPHLQDLVLDLLVSFSLSP